jgi:hypothetical protein
MTKGQKNHLLIHPPQAVDFVKKHAAMLAWKNASLTRLAGGSGSLTYCSFTFFKNILDDDKLLVFSIQQVFYKRRPEIKALIKQSTSTMKAIKSTGQNVMLSLETMFSTTTRFCFCMSQLCLHLHKKLGKDIQDTWLLD